MGSAVFLLALLSAQAFAIPCEDQVKKNHPPLTFEAVDQVLLDNDSSSGLVSLPKKKLEAFWHQTWPKLKIRTMEQGKKIGDVVEEYFSLGQSLLEGTPAGSDSSVASKISVSRVQLEFLRDLERLPVQANMKHRDWYHVSHAYSAFMNLGVLAIKIEPLFRDMPSFHPLATLTEKQVFKIMESLENSSVAHTAKLIEERRQQFDPRRMLGPRIRQALSPIIGSTESQEDISTPETHLALVLKNRLEFTPNFKYQLTNSSDEEYKIMLSPDVVREANHGEYDSIHKLLRTLVGNDRFKSGVKSLSRAGSNIVQVTSVLVGSKRLLGCLEENQLRLFTLETTANPVEIPANLCK